MTKKAKSLTSKRRAYDFIISRIARHIPLIAKADTHGILQIGDYFAGLLDMAEHLEQLTPRQRGLLYDEVYKLLNNKLSPLS